VAADPVLHVDPEELSRITLKILQAVRKDYWHSLSLTAIAKQHKMSGKYMGRVFLKDTGMRFTDYLLAFRMQEARRLILTTGEKISVVAGMVGYSQLNNFYTHFHQYYGISPSSLRNAPQNEEMTL
jgi:YesN/AraC family two-component response regulator